jgi:CubicO group peptidase (beta-lactamase class C family)
VLVADVLNGVMGAYATWTEAPRLAAAVVARDGTLLGTWGRDANEHTVFRIASMTKSFTAAMVLLLRDDGVVDLDRPIGEYASELAGVVGPGDHPAPLTLRHLLSMSSGLATDDPWADRHLNATDGELDGWLANGLRFAYPTGTAFEYSNLGFALVGRVVHRATGKRVQELISTRLLQPLGMTSTVWSIDALGANADIAPGWHKVADSLHAEPALADGVVAPMGGLWSTCHDLARWVSYLARAFDDDPDGPLSSTTRRELQQIHRGYAPGTATGPDGVVRVTNGGYGFGVNVQHHQQHGTVAWHSGGLPGYGSNMRWLPSGVGVIALANITYASMTSATAAILDALDRNDLIPSLPKLEVCDDVRSLAEAFIALINAWSTTAAEPMAADNVFADNVLPDRPADHRRDELHARFGTAPVTLRSIDAESAATAVLHIATDEVVDRVRIEVSPTNPPRIQTYEWL